MQQNPTNNPDGKIFFTAIEYNKAGEYSYTIREKSGTDETLTYDNSTYPVVVSVKEQNGKLNATASYKGNPEFKNIYTPENGSLILEASKILEGRSLSSGEFQFELVDKDEKVLQTATNNPEGKIFFDTIEYDEAGEYRYTIREKAGNDATISYDNSMYQVTVNVKDIDGQLIATPTYSRNLEFKNTYTPKRGSLAIEASTVLDGRQLSNGEFQFELVNKDGKVLQTTTNNSDGKIFFEAIEYDKAGEYQYTIREKSGNDSTITYDNRTYSVTVNVKDIDGQLIATPTYSGNPEFKNIYTIKKGSLVLEASKVLEGRSLNNSEFQFELVDKAGKVLQSATNNSEGKIFFSAIDYDKAGEYSYTIREKARNDATITYDSSSYQVTVNVKDIDGQLIATPTYSGNPEFKNIYTTKKGSLVLEASKVLEGRQLSNGEFQFELVDKDGKVVQTTTNDAAGKIFFEAIEYDKDGEYSYTIREKAGNDATITYDNSTYPVTVNVEEQNGKLIATASYTSNPEFKNTYTPKKDSLVLEASKVLDGRQMSNGEFEFELVDTDGKVIQTTTNNAAGSIYFKEIEYDKVGKYSYTIREKVGNDEHITYDKNEFSVSVNVVNNRGKLVATPTYNGTPTFKNTYTPKKGSIVLEASVVLEGRSLRRDEFQFELIDKDGKVLQTTTNNADGLIYFEEIEYDKAGEYSYTIREKAGNDQTITYDRKAHKVTVSVEQQAGQLTPRLASDSKIVFKNSYTSVEIGRADSGDSEGLTGSVTLKKIDKSSGKKLPGAKFELRNADSKVIMKELVTDKNGEVLISGLSAGEYHLVETQAPDGYVLDPTPIHFDIVENHNLAVNDEKLPANTTETITKTERKTTEKSLPKTGFNANLSILLIVIGYLLLTIFMIFSRKKKPQKEDEIEW